MNIFRKTPKAYQSKVVFSGRRPGRAKKNIFLIVAFCAAAAAVAYGAHRLANLPYVQIRDVSVAGAKTILENEVRAAIAENLSGSLLRFIPKTNYFFVSARSIEILLLEKFPRMREVRVQKKFPKSLIVTFSERDIWALYCNDSLYAKYAKEKNAVALSEAATGTSSVAPGGIDASVRHCFYVDETGMIIDSALSYQGTLLPIFFERRSENPRIGEKVPADDDMRFFLTAQEEFKKKIGAEITTLEKTNALPDDYILFFQEGWYALLPRSADVAFLAKNTKILLDTAVKDARTRLFYIDARFGNKMFYKLR